MAWDFSTEPEFQEHLDWMREFVREEIQPLETLINELEWDAARAGHGAAARAGQGTRAVGRAPRRRSWAARASARSSSASCTRYWAPPRSRPFAFGNAAPDSGNSEILALAGTPEQKERYLYPLLEGDLKSAFSMTEPNSAGSDPTLLNDGRRQGRRRLGHQRPQVVLLQRLDRRLPHRHGRHRPRCAQVPEGLDVRRRRRHARRRDRARRGDHGAPAGAWASYGNHAEIVYEDVRVPGSALLGARGRRLPHRSAAAVPGPHPPLHALARRLAARLRHALRVRAAARDERREAGREADGAELDRRLGRADGRGAADDAARRLEDGHRRASPRRGARSR